jgi:hypothetical protein
MSDSRPQQAGQSRVEWFYLCGCCGFIGREAEFDWIERGDEEPNVQCHQCGELFTGDDVGPALYSGPREDMEHERGALGLPA